VDFLLIGWGVNWAHEEIFMMASTLQTLGIDRMSIEERIALATAIWDSIAAEPHPPLLTKAQRLELERRLADHAANPNDVVPWEQIKAEALARFKQ
jgi:putative addiction module component (TIGR02574 family)